MTVDFAEEASGLRGTYVVQDGRGVGDKSICFHLGVDSEPTHSDRRDVIGLMTSSFVKC